MKAGAPASPQGRGGVCVESGRRASRRRSIRQQNCGNYGILPLHIERGTSARPAIDRLDTVGAHARG